MDSFGFESDFVFQIGSVLLFGDTTQEHLTAFANFMDDILACTMNDLRNQSATILEEFQKVCFGENAYFQVFG